MRKRIPEPLNFDAQKMVYMELVSENRELRARIKELETELEVRKSS